MSKLKFSQPVDELPGVGQAYSQKLMRLKVESVKDLLYHFPYRYLDRSTITKIKNVNRSSSYNIRGIVTKIFIRRAKSNSRMKLTEAIVEDETGEIKVIWFNQPFLKNVLSEKELLLSGQVSLWHGSPTLINPDYQLDKSKDNIHIGRIVPIYTQTKGLTSKWFRAKIFDLLENSQVGLDDYLDRSIKERYSLIGLGHALRQIHFPTSYNQLGEAKKRLAFDELLLTILHADLLTEKIDKLKSPKINFDKKESKKLISKLPYKLTDDQKKAAWQVIENIGSSRPMNRLLNGDVGSGKTIVAFIAALNVAKSGKQVAIMAPTEVLANQHYQKAKKYFKDFNLKIDLYTGSKKTIKLTKNNAQTDIVIGTQALIQNMVSLNNPGLVVVDEQQRFGVKQRQLLEKIGESKLRPHYLAMTATPIPRTLAISIYGDLGVSTIKQRPKQRKPVKTKLIKTRQGRQKTYQFIDQQLKNGHQVFVICPLISQNQAETDNQRNLENIGQLDEKKTVIEEYQKLKEGPFSNYNLKYLHGKIASEEKKKIMDMFLKKEIDILISTSVVEIGIDIPGANVMLIEGAERFGLSQLHQFRGRVGRSEVQSYCFLMPARTNENIDRRLTIMTSTNNGFKIAQEDLKIRGPGELIGERQHGYLDLKLASFFNMNLVKKTKKTAKDILKKSPDLKKYPQLANQIKSFNQKVDLG